MTAGRPRPAILFVCSGNTCRSPMAAALLTHMLAKEGIEADIWSRGMSPTPGQPLSPGAAEALQGSGVALPDHRSRRLAEQDVLRASLILTMEERHRQLLLNAYPSAEAKTFRLKEYAGEDGDPDVADPLGGSRADYEKCKMEIQNCLLNLFSKLKAAEGSHPS